MAAACGTGDAGNRAPSGAAGAGGDASLPRVDGSGAPESGMPHDDATIEPGADVAVDQRGAGGGSNGDAADGGIGADAGEGALKVTHLVCEYLTDPLGIDTPKPRLSWALESSLRAQKQTAYEIVVTGTTVDVWSTGKVLSAQQTHVPYSGQPLASGQRVTWKVRAWDANDKPSPFSAPASWEMGLLQAADWKGKWIGAMDQLAATTPPAPHLRRTFMVNKPVRAARAYVAGVGYGELWVNGKKMSDHVLDPGFTRFDKRVIYVTHDVTAALAQGNNAIGVILGNGFLNVHANDVWNFDNAPWRMPPRALVQLQIAYEDGTTQTVVSDESWKVANGPITFDGIRNGETYDARLEKPGWSTASYVEDASWKAALAVRSPGGVLSAQMFQPQKVVRSLQAAKVTSPQAGVYVFDFKQNTAGWAKITVSGAAGTQITLKYGEKLAANGTVDQSNIDVYVRQGAFQTDTYILKGQGTEIWEPRFTYHGFQYVEVRGFPGTPTAANVQAQVVNTAFDTIGTFTSSNDLLNRIYQATQWSYLANFQSIPTDCPQREKNGWTADAHLAAEQAMFNVDGAAAYTKWIRDFRDEMRPNGELAGIIPTTGWGYGVGPAWDSALLVIPWYLYQYTGDRQILESNYDLFTRYVDWLGTRDYINQPVSSWLGDWVPAHDVAPPPVAHAGYHAFDARVTAATAGLLGKAADVTKYNAVADQVKQRFLAKFFNAGTAQVAGDEQTSLSAALYMNLVNDADRPRVFDRLTAKIAARNNHLDTGVLGTKYLWPVLTDGGRADLFFKIATQVDFPSWGRWLQAGGTTLWEQWDDGGSHNHVFMGDIVTWFYRALAGINPDPAGPGFAQILIRPQVVGDLTSVKAETRTLRGVVSSAWRLQAGRLVLDVAIPVNSTATVSVPAASSDKVTADGATFVRSESGRQIYTVGSGLYTFSVAP
jgi:alpha-L-rhamnosidase